MKSLDNRRIHVMFNRNRLCLSSFLPSIVQYCGQFTVIAVHISQYVHFYVIDNDSGSTLLPLLSYI